MPRRLKDWRWHIAAKLGFALVRLWAREQAAIDGEPTQVREILHEVFSVYLGKLNSDEYMYTEGEYEL